MLLVASLQERDEQVENAAQLLAGVVHHGPGGGEGRANPQAGQESGHDTRNYGQAMVTWVPAFPRSPSWTRPQRPSV